MRTLLLTFLSILMHSEFLCPVALCLRTLCDGLAATCVTLYEQFDFWVVERQNWRGCHWTLGLIHRFLQCLRQMPRSFCIGVVVLEHQINFAESDLHNWRNPPISGFLGHLPVLACSVLDLLSVGQSRSRAQLWNVQRKKWPFLLRALHRSRRSVNLTSWSMLRYHHHPGRRPQCHPLHILYRVILPGLNSSGAGKCQMTH